MGFRKSKTKRELKSRIKKDFEILNKKRGRKVRIEIGQNLSIGDWVLCKRGLDGDNSYLKFLFNFRKRKLYIFQLHFMQLFSADAKIFLN